MECHGLRAELPDEQIPAAILVPGQVVLPPQSLVAPAALEGNQEMTPLPLLAPGTDIDEEGNWELPPTLPPDGSPPLTSNPPSGVSPRDGSMMASTPGWAFSMRWAVSPSQTPQNASAKSSHVKRGTASPLETDRC